MSPVDASEIERRRKEAGWTQAELARRAGVSRRTVIRIERGQREPHRATLAVLKAALRYVKGEAACRR